MQGIHILKGTGDNCTCGDCIVLYGGECDSTPVNNLLDKFDEFIEKEIVNKNKNPSLYQLNKAVDLIAKDIRKIESIKAKDFRAYYNLFDNLFFISWGVGHEVRKSVEYRGARWYAYLKTISEMKKYIKENEEETEKEDQ